MALGRRYQKRWWVKSYLGKVCFRAKNNAPPAWTELNPVSLAKCTPILVDERKRFLQNIKSSHFDCGGRGGLFVHGSCVIQGSVFGGTISFLADALASAGLGL